MAHVELEVNSIGPGTRNVLFSLCGVIVFCFVIVFVTRSLPFAGLMIICFGLVFLIAGFGAVRIARVVANTSTSRIRSLAMGLVEIKGKVVKFQKLVKCPVSGKQCVAFEVIAYSRGKKGEESRVLAKEQVQFMLQDKTGSVLVDPKGASVELKKPTAKSSDITKYGPGLLAAKNAYMSGMFLNVQDAMESVSSSRVKASFKVEGVVGKMFAGALRHGLGSVLRVEEYALYPGAEVYVLGTAKDNPYVAEGRSRVGVQDVMIQQDANKYFPNPYYITDRAEAAFQKKYSFGGWLFVLVGAVITAGGIVGFAFWL